MLEARDSLEYHIYTYSTARKVHEEVNGLTPADVYNHVTGEPYSDICHRWSLAFEAYLERHEGKMSDRERAATSILQMQNLFYTTSLLLTKRYTGEPDDEKLWDEYEAQFAEVVRLAEFAIALTPKAVGMQPSFTLDLGIVGPLYDIAQSCRDPFLRRRAIHLLRASARREGMWDGTLAARILERVVAIEERGLPKVAQASDVPHSARLTRVWPTFAPDGRRAILSFGRVGGPVGVTVQEVIEW